MRWSDELFQEDQFSNSKMEWGAVESTTELGTFVKDFITEYYPALNDETATCRVAGHGTINSANVLFETPTKKIVVKVLSQKQSQKAKYLEMVNAKLPKAFEYSPRLIASEPGSLITEHADRLFLVYEKLGDKHYSGKLTEFRKFLEVYNAFTNQFPTETEGFEQQPTLSPDCKKTLDDFIYRYKQSDAVRPYVETLENKYSFLVEKIALSLSVLDAPHLHKLRPLHIDLHPHNLSLERQGLFF